MDTFITFRDLSRLLTCCATLLSNDKDAERMLLTGFLMLKSKREDFIIKVLEYILNSLEEHGKDNIEVSIDVLDSKVKGSWSKKGKLVLLLFESYIRTAYCNRLNYNPVEVKEDGLLFIYK